MVNLAILTHLDILAVRLVGQLGTLFGLAAQLDGLGLGGGSLGDVLDGDGVAGLGDLPGQLQVSGGAVRPGGVGLVVQGHCHGVLAHFSGGGGAGDGVEAAGRQGDSLLFAVVGLVALQSGLCHLDDLLGNIAHVEQVSFTCLGTLIGGHGHHTLVGGHPVVLAVQVEALLAQTVFQHPGHGVLPYRSDRRHTWQ